MVVHHIHASWEDAQNRFLGPEKLLERVTGLLPDFSLFGMSWEWKGWVDTLEASGRLVPILRWRVPDAALNWLWAHHDDREDDMRALEAEAEAGVNAGTAWGRARRAWTRDPACARSLHPLDKLDAEWAILLEDPGQVAWTRDTYAPLMVPRTRDGRLNPDRSRCVPLFRGWQALLFAEIALAGPRVFPPPPDPPGADDLPPPIRWVRVSLERGFEPHRQAFEALSWFVAYRHHALQHAQTEAPDPGMFASPGTVVSDGRFVIRGAAHQALLREEERVAREALDRHGVSEEALLAAAGWAGWSAHNHRRAGHLALSRAYAEEMRNAVELLVSLGQRRDDVTARIRHGDDLRREFFPDFEESGRGMLHDVLRTLASNFAQYPNPVLPNFDGARIEDFIRWLEDRGLLAAHMGVPAVMEFGGSPDRAAEVGVALHVASLAAWLEHVAGELTSGLPDPPRFLPGKLKGCWAGHPGEQPFRQALNNVMEHQRQLQLGFQDTVAMALALAVPDQQSWMVREAFLAHQIRNECLHQGMRECTRIEMQDAMCILLRVTMGAWLAVTSRP